MKDQPIQILFIDPFKHELRKAEIASDIHAWHKLLKCDYVECVQLSYSEGCNLDLWCDEEFLLKDIPAPAFLVARGPDADPQTIHGYAFLACSNQAGDTVSIGQAGMNLPIPVLTQILGLHWEQWGIRVKQDDYLDEVMRTPELDTPTFRFLDSCPNCGKSHS